MIIRIFFLFLVLTATALFAADIYMSWPIELILSVNSAKSILELDGHRVDIDFVSSVPARRRVIRATIPFSAKSHAFSWTRFS